jgi:hypothetical protein
MKHGKTCKKNGPRPFFFQWLKNPAPNLGGGILSLQHTLALVRERLSFFVGHAFPKGSVCQYGYACERLTECGRMAGGWLKSVL